MTDLVVTDPGKLERLRRVYPNAVGYGHARGPLFQIRAEVRRRHNRGDIIALWPLARAMKRPGHVAIPFVVIRTQRQIVARRLAYGVAGVAVVAGVLAGAAYALWCSREVIAQGMGAIAVAALLVWLAPHWGRGCAGLHCSGCSG